VKAAAYLRVSSRAQTAKMQRAAIELAAEARGDSIRHEYVEHLSGRTIARPELQRLREHARAGHVRKLYVFRIDRLTRSGVRDTLNLVHELRDHGCEVVSVADGFDLAGPGADIVLAVMAWAAEVERLAINERISAARDRVEREGGRWGRPRRMGAAEVARARQLVKAGRSVRQVAIALKIPRATVQRAVSKSRGARAERARMVKWSPAPLAR
jgi:DNA invertase Pin-like site-specific DNA recombinase